MGVPIHQIQMYRKAPAITKTLPKNSQICPSNQKTSEVFTKSQQNLKKILKCYGNLCSIEK